MIPLRHFTLKRYIKYVRKQNKHVQHVHGVVFAGAITSVIAAVILYTDYGFWHERYVSEDVLLEQQAAESMKSPGQTMASFWQEAKERFGGIGKAGSELLEGKEQYTKEE